MIPLRSDNKLLIGVCGRCGSGKDTFASRLTSARAVGFAHALKQRVAHLFGCTVYDVDRAKNEEPAVRQMLITIAQRERVKNPDHWVEKLDHWINVLDAALPPSPTVVIPDVRFFNEQHYISKNNGVLIKSIRPDRTPTEFDNDESETTHLLFAANVTITNTTLEDFNTRSDYVYDLIRTGSLSRDQSIEGVSIDREWQRSGKEGKTW